MSAHPLKACLLTSSQELSRFIDIISSAFATTPLTTAFIVEIDSAPPPYPSPLLSSARRRRHFAQGINDASEHGAELVQAGDWSAVALWEPPGFEGKVFTDVGRSGPLRDEWKCKLKVCKERHLLGRPFYHLAFLARNSEKETVQRAIRAVSEPYLERARKEGVRMWLEATNPKAVALYERFGFKIVETITLGVGTMNGMGWPEEGGEGLTGYCMIYEP